MTSMSDDSRTYQAKFIVEPQIGFEMRLIFEPSGMEVTLEHGEQVTVLLRGPQPDGHIYFCPDYLMIHSPVHGHITAWDRNGNEIESI